MEFKVRRITLIRFTHSHRSPPCHTSSFTSPAQPDAIRTRQAVDAVAVHLTQSGARQEAAGDRRRGAAHRRRHSGSSAGESLASLGRSAPSTSTSASPTRPTPRPRRPVTCARCTRPWRRSLMPDLHEVSYVHVIDARGCGLRLWRARRRSTATSRPASDALKQCGEGVAPSPKAMPPGPSVRATPPLLQPTCLGNPADT
jgi:4-oxalocrotonate tautomerase